MGSFAASLLANSNKLLREVNEKCYAIARELFTSIVELSPSPLHPGPYADGYLVNQWYPTDGPGFSEELGPSNDTSINGMGSLTRIGQLRGNQFRSGDGAVTLTSNVHYAYRAEVLGWPAEEGWSGRIGPYRMVALSLQKIAAKYK